MIAPIPSAISDSGPRLRFSVSSPSASASSVSMGLVAISLIKSIVAHALMRPASRATHRDAWLLQRLVQPGNHFRLPVLHLRSTPVTHAMLAVFNRNQLAAYPNAMHSVTKRRGLLIRDLIVFRAVNAQKRRHSLMYRGNRRQRAQLRQTRLIQLVHAEE